MTYAGHQMADSASIPRSEVALLGTTGDASMGRLMEQFLHEEQRHCDHLINVLPVVPTSNKVAFWRTSERLLSRPIRALVGLTFT